MVKKYKRVNKPSSIGSTYEADLVNKLSSYAELIGVDRTKLVSSILNKELEGRILTNTFIELDKPFYFDFKKLIHEGKAEATIDKPVIEPERLYILKKVPNNLDKPNKKYGTYSFKEDNPSFHKGVYYYSLVQAKRTEDIDNMKEIEEGSVYALDNAYFIDFYFLFEYEQESNKIVIHSIEEENLGYEIDPLVYPNVYEYLEKTNRKFCKDLLLPDGKFNLFVVLNFFSDVMISYYLYKSTDFDLRNRKEEDKYLKGYSEFKDFINK